ncbi:hypothetical protein DPEC_G00238030 [Dallia pectoralis]|uniref:Uncharacterized protein n=1 Tax=Dallia pectoralis TaxID=75939 RepID=A0ACC2FYK2_DALPE|nr:hypothetical protein DPEC_G00238030 [Dallia pectoralis]
MEHPVWRNEPWRSNLSHFQDLSDEILLALSLTLAMSPQPQPRTPGFPNSSKMSRSLITNLPKTGHQDLFTHHASPDMESGRSQRKMARHSSIMTLIVASSYSEETHLTQ